MSSDIAIRVSSLGKCYHVYENPAHRLLQMLWRGRKNYYREFWAVEDVSFEIRRGETVGVIGRNGAGKTTLLQMICGTLNPTTGSIEVNGKVAALLELGAGFNPEFTGRENVYLAASLYGLNTGEVDKRFDQIAAFADIGDFIQQPVKTYSSGMFVRLAFSVIAHVNADILVIDEALSVGDAYFQQKCMRFLADFQRNGGTLLFVSHDIGAVNALCASAILLRRLDHGYLCDAGSARTISNLYLRELYDERARTSTLVAQVSESMVEIENRQDIATISGRTSKLRTYFADEIPPTRYHVSPFRSDAESFGAGGGIIISALFQGPNGEVLTEFTSSDDVKLVINARTSKPMMYPAIGFMLKDRKGQYLITESTDSYLREAGISVNSDQKIEAVFSMRLPSLVRGEYALDVAFAEGPADDHLQHHWMHDVLVLTAINNSVIHGISGAQSLSVRLTIL